MAFRSVARRATYGRRRRMRIVRRRRAPMRRVRRIRTRRTKRRRVVRRRVRSGYSTSHFKKLSCLEPTKAEVSATAETALSFKTKINDMCDWSTISAMYSQFRIKCIVTRIVPKFGYGCLKDKQKCFPKGFFGRMQIGQTINAETMRKNKARMINLTRPFSSKWLPYETRSATPTLQTVPRAVNMWLPTSSKATSTEYTSLGLYVPKPDFPGLTAAEKLVFDVYHTFYLNFKGRRW